MQSHTITFILCSSRAQLSPPHGSPARPAKHSYLLHTMTNSIRITIEGVNLDDHHDGDWTISVFKDDKLAAQSGLSGTPDDAIQAARDTAIDADIRLGDTDE